MNHKFWNAAQGRPEGVTHAVKNSDTVTIPSGTPVVYTMNGTDDGLQVVLPSTSNAAAINAFTVGVATKDIPAGKLGEVAVYGFIRNARVARTTRAASTAAWGSMAAIAIATPLAVDTTYNAFASSTAGQTFIDPWVVAAENVASTASLPSSVGGTATVLYQSVRAFLRFM